MTGRGVQQCIRVIHIEKLNTDLYCKKILEFLRFKKKGHSFVRRKESCFILQSQSFTLQHWREVTLHLSLILTILKYYPPGQYFFNIYGPNILW